MTPAKSIPVLDPAAMKRHAGGAAKLVRALSNEHRLLVLCVLSEGELSVGDLNSRVRLSQSALSQHLAVLRRERLVYTRRSAQTIFYKVANGVAMELIRVLHDHYCGAAGRAAPRPAGKGTRAARLPAGTQ
jgi:DNA-binding transcriptional ArsR family regulator